MGLVYLVEHVIALLQGLGAAHVHLIVPHAGGRVFHVGHHVVLETRRWVISIRPRVPVPPPPR